MREDLIALVGLRAAERLEPYGAELANLPPAELEALIGPKAAAKLRAAFSLRGAAQEMCKSRPKILDAGSAVAVLAPKMGHLDHEEFWAILLDARHQVRRVECIARGGLTTCLVLPREVLAPFMRWSCPGGVVAHNHPSGDPTPSQDDLALTARLKGAFAFMGVTLLDHIVIARPGDRWESMKLSGQLAAL